MSTRRLFTFCMLLSSELLSAQPYTGEGPPILSGPRANPRLGASGLGNGVTEVAQLLLTPISGSTFYLTATVRRASGPGGYDLIAGTWNEATQTFVMSTEVEHFNSPGDEFALSVSPDRLVAAFDTPAGAQWAGRSSTSAAFGAPRAIANVPAGYVDPQLCMINRQLSLLFMQDGHIFVGDFTNGWVANKRIAVFDPGTHGRPHSPSPIADDAGNTRGLLFAAHGNGSELWFTPTLDALQQPAPPRRLLARGTWLANPDANGGLVRAAESTAGTYGDPVEVEIAGSTAAYASNNGDVLHLFGFTAPKTTGTLPNLAIFILGPLAPAPIRLPFLGGAALGCDPATGLVTSAVPIPRATGSAYLPLSVPAMPGVAFTGFTQLLVFNPDNGAAVLGGMAPMGILIAPTACTKSSAEPDSGGGCPPGLYARRDSVILKNGQVHETIPNCVACYGPCPPPTHCTARQVVAATATDRHGNTWTYIAWECVCL